MTSLQTGLRSVISEWLRISMARSGVVNQVELAEKSGVARSTISNILNRKRDAEAQTLLKLAQAMSVDPPDISIPDGGASPREEPEESDDFLDRIVQDPIEFASRITDRLDQGMDRSLALALIRDAEGMLTRRGYELDDFFAALRKSVEGR